MVRRKYMQDTTKVKGMKEAKYWTDQQLIRYKLKLKSHLQLTNKGDSIKTMLLNEVKRKSTTAVIIHQPCGAT